MLLCGLSCGHIVAKPSATTSGQCNRASIEKDSNNIALVLRLVQCSHQCVQCRVRRLSCSLRAAPTCAPNAAATDVLPTTNSLQNAQTARDHQSCCRNSAATCSANVGSARPKEGSRPLPSSSSSSPLSSSSSTYVHERKHICSCNWLHLTRLIVAMATTITMGGASRGAQHRRSTRATFAYDLTADATASSLQYAKAFRCNCKLVANSTLRQVAHSTWATTTPLQLAASRPLSQRLLRRNTLYGSLYSVD